MGGREQEAQAAQGDGKRHELATTGYAETGRGQQVIQQQLLDRVPVGHVGRGHVALRDRPSGTGCSSR